MKALSFELEYAKEDNGDLIDSNAWNALVGWQLDTAWKPKISYRYAVFEGDDPNTDGERGLRWTVDRLLRLGQPGGRVKSRGEYFASNSNLVSSQLRVHAKPNDAIGTGLILYDFTLENTESAGVTSDNLATELDWYMDWSLNDNFIVSVVAAYAHPGRGRGAGRSIATRTSTTEWSTSRIPTEPRAG